MKNWCVKVCASIRAFMVTWQVLCEPAQCPLSSRVYLSGYWLLVLTIELYTFAFACSTCRLSSVASRFCVPLFVLFVLYLLFIVFAPSVNNRTGSIFDSGGGGHLYHLYHLYVDTVSQTRLKTNRMRMWWPFPLQTPHLISRHRYTCYLFSTSCHVIMICIVMCTIAL